MIMRLFGKRKKKESKVIKKVEKPESKQEYLENGELPFGWIYRNKVFVEKIQNEFTYFLDRWVESRRKPAIEQYAALKSFVLYMEDVERLCKSKGECFEFWFNEILTGKGYLEKRRIELKTLEKGLN